jgi:WD40 repeat protein
VTIVDFTADSMHVLSGSAQGTISLWESSNGTLVKTFNVHDDEVRAICCFSDGTRVVSCDKSDVTHIWSLSYLEEMNQVEILSSVSGIRAPMFLRLNDSMLIGHSSKSPKE